MIWRTTSTPEAACRIRHNECSLCSASPVVKPAFHDNLLPILRSHLRHRFSSERHRTCSDVPTMPCFLLLILLLFPRVALVLMWIYSTYLQRAFHGGLVLPVLGFIFLPLTTIVYAWELNSGMPMAGINLLWLLIAVIIDLGGLGGGAHRQSRR
ncbi:MAG: hypothetical protein ABSF62_16610 [Bryobacteraceae bacterium]